MRLFFLPIAAIILIAGYLLISNQKAQNPIEQSVALWNDGTDAFYRQVLAGNGEWVESAGTPVFDNQRVAALPTKPTQTKNIDSAVLGSHIAADGSEKWIEVSLGFGERCYLKHTEVDQLAEETIIIFPMFLFLFFSQAQMFLTGKGMQFTEHIGTMILE